MDRAKLKAFLEGLYYVYARRELVYPDPLYYLYRYEDLRDREIAGLVASSLAYGRVMQIMKDVEKVLACLGDRPYEFLKNNKNFQIVPEGFKHRFTTGYDMNNFLANIAGVIRDYDSLEAFMAECLRKAGGNMLAGLDMFAERLSRNKKDGAFPLVTAPKDGSACKRVFLFLRWMVRCDDVDPGGWNVLKPSRLIVPTDTHMHHIALRLGLTTRKTADLMTARQISTGFAAVSASDTAKYDFVLTRFGIRQLNAGYITRKT